MEWQPVERSCSFRVKAGQPQSRTRSSRDPGTVGRRNGKRRRTAAGACSKVSYATSSPGSRSQWSTRPAIRFLISTACPRVCSRWCAPRARLSFRAASSSPDSTRCGARRISHRTGALPKSLRGSRWRPEPARAKKQKENSRSTSTSCSGGYSTASQSTVSRPITDRSSRSAQMLRIRITSHRPTSHRQSVEERFF